MSDERGAPFGDWSSEAGELERRAVLGSYPLDDPALRRQLDRLAALAARICGTPVGLVSLVSENTQDFIGRSGLDGLGTPRSQSFCAFAMHEPAAMVIPDATVDPRFAANPLVTGEPGIRFYAGQPLISPEGAPLGSLCVIDVETRDGLTPAQAEALATLAEAAMAQLERPRREHSTARVADEFADLEQRFAVLVDAMPQLVWSTRANGSCDYLNARWGEFTGIPDADSFGGGWLKSVHADDLATTRQAWNSAVTTGERYQIEYRLRRHDGEYRWMIVHGLPLRGADGTITRWIGTCTDIHEQKDANDRLEMLSQELSHRIKNIFAVIGGLLSLSLRGRPEFADIGGQLHGRILALGRAHDFVRPSRGQGGEASVSALLARLFEAYRDGDRERIVIVGGDVAIDDRAATPLALLFHELATNSAKYGALSATGGTVDLTVREGDPIVFEWRERGGPPVSEPTERGFGRQLMELSVERQLGGELDFEWAGEGAAITARIPRSALHR